MKKLTIVHMANTIVYCISNILTEARELHKEFIPWKKKKKKKKNFTNKLFASNYIPQVLMSIALVNILDYLSGKKSAISVWSFLQKDFVETKKYPQT